MEVVGWKEVKSTQTGIYIRDSKWCQWGIQNCSCAHPNSADLPPKGEREKSQLEELTTYQTTTCPLLNCVLIREGMVTGGPNSIASK